MPTLDGALGLGPSIRPSERQREKAFQRGFEKGVRTGVEAALTKALEADCCECEPCEPECCEAKECVTPSQVLCAFDVVIQKALIELYGSMRLDDDLANIARLSEGRLAYAKSCGRA